MFDPAPRPLPSARRDTLALTLLIGFLLTMAWQSERARGAQSPPAASTSPLAACDGQSDETGARDACLEQAVVAVLGSGAPLARSLERINDHARRDDRFSRRCHMLLHEHGARHDGDVRPGTIEHDGKDCAAGFLHGWMMEHLGDLDRPTVAAWCDPSRTMLEAADCEHGMGHVLVRHLDGALPAALRRCRALGDATFLRNCASGVYMENRFRGQGGTTDATSRFWRTSDAWLPCRSATPNDLLDVCAAWAVRDVAPARRLRWCRNVGRSVDATACRIASGGIARVDRAARAACGADAACWYGRGFAWAMLGWNQPDTEVAAERCLAGPRQLRAACARGVGFRRASSLSDELARAQELACDDDFSGLDRDACRAGAARRGDPIAYA